MVESTSTAFAKSVSREDSTASPKQDQEKPGRWSPVQVRSDLGRLPRVG
jgi:hypothetical protein